MPDRLEPPFQPPNAVGRSQDRWCVPWLHRWRLFGHQKQLCTNCGMFRQT